jgi:hypothetical protein
VSEHSENNGKTPRRTSPRIRAEEGGKVTRRAAAREGRKKGARLFWAMTDGEWRTVADLVGIVGDVIPPELAVRAAQRRNEEMERADLEEQVSAGKHDILRVVLNGMERKGWLEAEKQLNHQNRMVAVRYRLHPEVWSRITAKPGSLPILLNELRRMLERHKCEVVVRIKK